MRLGDLLQRQHFLGRTNHLLHTSESASPEGLGHLVLGDVVRVPILLHGPLGLGLPALGLGAERRAHFFLLSFLLQLLQFVEEEVELL